MYTLNVSSLDSIDLIVLNPGNELVYIPKEPSPGPVRVSQTSDGTWIAALLGDTIPFTGLVSTWKTINDLFFIEDQGDVERAHTNLDRVELYIANKLVLVLKL